MQTPPRRQGLRGRLQRHRRQRVHGRGRPGGEHRHTPGSPRRTTARSTACRPPTRRGGRCRSPPTTSNVTATSTTGVATDFTFTAVGGFGQGTVAQYLYAWDTNPTHTWTGSEAIWNSGVLISPRRPAGSYYLHVKGFNGEDVGQRHSRSRPVFVRERAAHQPDLRGRDPRRARRRVAVDRLRSRRSPGAAHPPSPASPATWSTSAPTRSATSADLGEFGAHTIRRP